MAEPRIYTVGGTVQTNEQGLYISRPTDAELLSLCQQGEFAFVLTPRQMGKSSLMIRTAEQWIEAGGQAVIIDLALIGTQLTAEQWYRGLLTPIAEQLMLRVSLDNWWQAHSNLGLTQRLTLFLQQVVLAEVQEPVVIFVDEIDTTLSLDFTDDFFVAIRSLYVARTTQPELRRLSFVLIGVAMPGDLIRDSQRTPFNIGHRVDLTDFTLAEAMPLATGLGLTGAAAEQTLGWVLEWTGGHPYLTQRLCQEMAQVGDRVWTQSEVDRLVRRTFLGAQSEQDNNLQFVRNMLTQRATEPVAVLQTYRQIRRGKPAVVDEEQSLVKSHLKLSGVVKREGKTLRVRNRIYQQVFDRTWIREHLPETWWQRLKPAMPLIASLLLFSGITTMVAVYAEGQRYSVETAKKETELARRDAVAQQQKAELKAEEALNQKARADKEAQNAKQQQQRAEEALKEVEKQRNQANLNAEIARRAQASAEQQKEVAQTAQGKAEQQALIAQEQRQGAEQRQKEAEVARKARDLVGRANELIRQDQFDDAIRLSKEAIGLDPKYADAYFSLGLARSKLSELDKAKESLQEAIRLSSSSRNAYYYTALADVLEQQGKLEDAISSLRDAISIDRRFGINHFKLFAIKRRLLNQRRIPTININNSTVYDSTEQEDLSVLQVLQSVVRIMVKYKTTDDSKKTIISTKFGTGWIVKRENGLAWVVTTRDLVHIADDKTPDNITVQFFSQLPNEKIVHSAVIVNETNPKEKLNLAVLKVTGVSLKIEPLAFRPNNVNHSIRGIVINPHAVSGWVVSSIRVYNSKPNSVSLHFNSDLGSSDALGTPIIDENRQIIGLLTSISAASVNINLANGETESILSTENSTTTITTKVSISDIIDQDYNYGNVNLSRSLGIINQIDAIDKKLRIWKILN